MTKTNSAKNDSLQASIIPYASKASSLEILAGRPITGQYLCFGVRDYSEIYLGDNLDILDYTKFPLEGNGPIAFVMPRDGTLLSITAYFYFMSNSYINSEVQIVTRLYQANQDTEIYKAIPNTIVYLEPKINNNTPGTTLNGKLTNLNIDLKAESRIIMIVYIISNDPDANAHIFGYAGAGLNIK